LIGKERRGDIIEIKYFNARKLTHFNTKKNQPGKAGFFANG